MTERTCYLDSDANELEASVRTANVFTKMGLKTCAEVLNTPDAVFMAQKNFGRKSLAEVHELRQLIGSEYMPEEQRKQAELARANYERWRAEGNDYASQREKRRLEIIEEKMCKEQRKALRAEIEKLQPGSLLCLYIGAAVSKKSAAQLKGSLLAGINRREHKTRIVATLVPHPGKRP